MKGILSVVLNRDSICCPLGPSFLICKMKELDNIKIFFLNQFLIHIYVDIYLIYVYIFKIVHLSILTSFSSQQPRRMQRGASQVLW